jgi:hypothetical protein
MRVFILFGLMIIISLTYFNYNYAKNQESKIENIHISYENKKLKEKNPLEDFQANLLDNIDKNKKQNEGINETLNNKINENLKEEINKNKDLFVLQNTLPNQTINTWDRTKPFEFTFTDDVDLESFFNHFSLEPNDKDYFSGEIVYKNDQNKNIVKVTPYPKLKEGVLYTINLDKGIKNLDKDKELKESVSLQFTSK